MGELLLDEDAAIPGRPWSVERRFRVTEVFLAVLWVRCISRLHTYNIGGFGGAALFGFGRPDFKRGYHI